MTKILIKFMFYWISWFAAQSMTVWQVFQLLLPGLGFYCILFLCSILGDFGMSSFVLKFIPGKSLLLLILIIHIYNPLSAEAETGRTFSVTPCYTIISVLEEKTMKIHIPKNPSLLMQWVFFIYSLTKFFSLTVFSLNHNSNCEMCTKKLILAK